MWYTYAVFDDRLKGCTTYDKDGNPVQHNNGFVYYGAAPKTEAELHDILEMLIERHAEIIRDIPQ